MTMTEVKYGQGVSDVRVSLVSYATQFVGNPYVWGGTSLTRRSGLFRICSDLYMRNMASHFHTHPELHRQDAERRSVLRRHSREIFSSTATAAGINHVGYLYRRRSVWYMQVHRRPESRSLGCIVIRTPVMCCARVELGSNKILAFTTETYLCYNSWSMSFSPYSVDGHSDLLLSIMRKTGDQIIRRTNTC